MRTVEDRAHTEVDRAREELKALRASLTQIERASQAARDTAVLEHKEVSAHLRAAERDASAQRARAEALEGQLKRLGTPAPLPKKQNKGDPLAKLRKQFDALVAHMQTPAHAAAVETLFTATAEEIGMAASARARGASVRKTRKN